MGAKVKVKRRHRCIVCGKPAKDKLWCYSGKNTEWFCSEECFKKACELFAECER
jgi:hypothetical protein